jgi:hypothetical protein
MPGNHFGRIVKDLDNPPIFDTIDIRMNVHSDTDSRLTLKAELEEDYAGSFTG